MVRGTYLILCKILKRFGRAVCATDNPGRRRRFRARSYILLLCGLPAFGATITSTWIDGNIGAGAESIATNGNLTLNSVNILTDLQLVGSGTVTLSGSGTFNALSGGALNIGGGGNTPLRTNNVSIQSDTGRTLTIQTSRTTNVNGSLKAAMNIQGGSLKGSGSITGGNYTQTAGASSFDNLILTSSGTSAGALDIFSFGGFTPSDGEVFRIITLSSLISDGFAPRTSLIPNFTFTEAPGVTFLDRNAHSAVSVPEPSTMLLMLAGLCTTGILACVRKRRQAQC